MAEFYVFPDNARHDFVLLDDDFHRTELPECSLNQGDVNGRRHSRLLRRWTL
ncbi:hypothetical protein NFS79_004686 [Salmonella enterica]|nr:hypothetical protein [Salmonella enterica]EGI0930736.1 hypothetical protein [Salmonella enterica]EIB2579035.1 hypothetical protein [Salmonella enterica]EIB2596130.1 hypothetical protein [Salmonella enterica]EIB2615009.1 hypothetical protein [Salmonella enterica]